MLDGNMKALQLSRKLEAQGDCRTSSFSRRVISQPSVSTCGRSSLLSALRSSGFRDTLVSKQPGSKEFCCTVLRAMHDDASPLPVAGVTLVGPSFLKTFNRIMLLAVVELHHSLLYSFLELHGINSCNIFKSTVDHVASLATN